MAATLLSIAMIFKNDIRSIERCLKALQPLREAVPCELVMADTGSTDGSRAIAEQYADILFEFPWINDFAAARNAVLDRCSGIWCLILDTDEYLDENVSELVDFLKTSDGRKELFCTVIVRNYGTYEMDGDYSDFMAGRILRMSSGLRYQGAIHERWDFEASTVQVCPLSQTILHHDGYVGMNQNTPEGKAKIERNLKMIRQEFETDQKNLLVRLQLIESGGEHLPDYMELIRQSVKLVESKEPGWEKVGPALLRYAVYAAERRNLPEQEQWIQMAEEWFPDSMFTRLDVEYAAFVFSWNKKNYTDCIVRGKRYLKALEDYQDGADPLARMYSVLMMTTPAAKHNVKIYLAGSYCWEGQPGLALEQLKSLSYGKLTAEQTKNLLKPLQDIQVKSSLDTVSTIIAVWEGITRPTPSQKRADERQAAFIQAAGTAFRPEIRQAERAKEGFVRHAYTLYLPLQGTCEVGAAAAVLETDDSAEMESILSEAGSWERFSIHALAHALEHGARFPLPGKTLTIEEMDSLASRLSGDKERYFPLVLRLAEGGIPENWQALCWLRGLFMAAVKVFPWGGEETDEEQGMDIARTFARLEGVFLPICYNADILRAEQLFILPPLHRYGWYCAQAFEALENGDSAEYVRLLRSGLDVCKGMKDMVEFLLNQAAALERLCRAAAAPPELLELARQVQVTLARFDPNDPAVAQLKASPAYQTVAWLIEKPARAFGCSLPQ